MKNLISPCWCKTGKGLIQCPGKDVVPSQCSVVRGIKKFHNRSTKDQSSDTNPAAPFTPELDPTGKIVGLLWRKLQKSHVTFSVSANHAYCHDIQPGSGPENGCLCQCNWESLQSVQWGWFDLYIKRPRPLLVVSHPSLLMYPLLEKAYHKFTCNHKIFFSSDIIVDSILN